MTSAVDVACRLVGRFAVPGQVIDVRRFGNGLINDTFLVVTDAPLRGILQRVNEEVFPTPERIQYNLRRLIDHVSQRLGGVGGQVCVPAIVPTLEGADFYRGAEGFWRMSRFVEGSESCDVLADERCAREVGLALGRFHAVFGDLPCEDLHETLPEFHDTPAYLQRFEQLAADQAAASGDDELQSCFGFIERRRSAVDVLQRALQQGRVRKRVIHGDPKLNNVLFDARSGRALGLIDLDTVMAGLVHHDLGDCLRSCCNTAGEMGHAGGQVRFDTAICRAVLHGYCAGAGESLTADDVALLYDAIRLIPLELGLRFLIDHLEGDVYFRVTVPRQNLHRACVQFRLVQSIEQQEWEIKAICEAAFSETERSHVA